MNLWIESIGVEDGNIPLLPWHQKRVNRTVRDHWPSVPPPVLHEISVPERVQKGWHKCRILYSKTIRSIEWIPYTISPIHRLIVREAPGLKYDYKYADRQPLNELKSDLDEGEEVLITQEGFLRDTSYANILCFDGRNCYTPEQPLLNGCRRQQLLDRNTVQTAPLKKNDLNRFEYIQLINAMLDTKRGPKILMKNVKW